MTKPLELRQLRYFVAIVECGSVSRAAAQVNVVQPALSRQINQLEDELSTSLLVRSARGVSPTESGAALYRHAKRILQLADETKQAVQESRDIVAGRVKVGMPSSIAMAITPILINRLNTEFPNIILEIHESPSAYLATNLLKNRIDIGILVDDVFLPGMKKVPLFREPLCFVQSKIRPLIDCGSHIAANMLINVPFYLPTKATALRVAIDHLFIQLGTPPLIRAEASSINTLLHLVADGEAATVLVPSALINGWAKMSMTCSIIEPSVFRQGHVATSIMNELSVAVTTVKSMILSVTKQLILSGRWQGTIPSHEHII